MCVELIYEDYKYALQVAKMSPTSYFIVLNDSYVTVEAHRLVTKETQPRSVTMETWHQF